MRKLKILGIFLAVIFMMIAVDFVKMQTVQISVESIEPTPAVANPKNPVTLQVRLTDKRGNPVEGHNLYALTLGGGSFKSYREKTDDNGCVTFIYYPYKVASYQEARDVLIKIRDESNSIFIEMYPEIDISIPMIKEDAQDKDGITVDDILGG